MMRVRLATLLAGASAFLTASTGALGDEPVTAGAEDRAYTISVLQSIADPVLGALREGRLRETMPDHGLVNPVSQHTSELQAFGRTLMGMSYWLSLGSDDTPEGILRGEYAALARDCIPMAVDPDSPDYMFGKTSQHTIAHASDLAFPMLIAREQLWEPLAERDRNNFVKALKTHRGFQPIESNWLLFAAAIECVLWELTGECDLEPIEHAVNRHMNWYLGDGVYGDGREFHWDYYNSYTIQPLLIEVVRVCEKKGHPLGELLMRTLRRGERYAVILEHLISPEGTMPMVGRSSVYRFGALHHLGYFATRHGLPDLLEAGATRAAMTAVIRNVADAPGTFGEGGFLNPGIVGHQPEAVDSYILTGSLYNCVLGFSHLGMPAESAFWTAPPGRWTQKRVWMGDKIAVQEVFDRYTEPRFARLDEYRKWVRRAKVLGVLATVLVVVIAAMSWRLWQMKASRWG